MNKTSGTRHKFFFAHLLSVKNNFTRCITQLQRGGTRIVVHVDLQPIADELHGDYINDKSFKRHFQQWLNSLWQEKDRLLTSLMSSQRQDKYILLASE